MNSPEAVLLVGLALVIYAVYRGVSALGRGKAASARYLKMQTICAVHGAAPGPVDMPGVFNLAGVGFLFGLSNQFTNAADFSSRQEKRTLFFTLVTARFPGIDMPLVTVTRKGRRLAFMILDLPMIQWILDCAEVNFAMLGNGLVAYAYRGDQGGPLFKPGEPRPVTGDGSELELLYKFVDGFGEKIPAVLRAEFAASAQ